MRVDTKFLKLGFRRYASRLKRTLVFGVINPTRYLLDLASVHWASRRRGVSTKTSPIRVALISDLDAYCSEEQFYPFSEWRGELRDKLGLVSLHLRLGDALGPLKLILSSFDIIGLKMSYRTTPAEALRVVSTFRKALRDKFIIYFDGDDDLCIQWPEILSYVDLYVKKHAFRDRNCYLKRFIGKSNLHDYVHNKYGHTFSTRDYGNVGDKPTLISGSGPVTSDQLLKIKICSNLASDRIIMSLYRNRSRFSTVTKEADVLFRGSAASEVWSYHLRGNIAPKLKQLEHRYRIVISNKRVPPEEYYREMASSKICISPFGFGEICWRDFEAVLCRCLLIKPDMSHVETYPDIFQAHETYVPVKWDFSDLQEKCTYYLTNAQERERIVGNALMVLEDFYKNGGFTKSVSKILEVWSEKR